MDELFRPIEGFPGYRISKTGEVESCWIRRGRAVLLGDTWRSLKPIRRRHGHSMVNLSRDGAKSSRLVHRLVLEAFVGPCPPGLICCHDDGDPANNRVENLRWDTYKSNSDDALRHGTRAVGSRCNSKLTEDEVVQIRRLRDEGVPTGEIASRFEVSEHNIKAIVYRKTWKHLPDRLVGNGGDGLTHLEGPGCSPGVAA